MKIYNIRILALLGIAALMSGCAEYSKTYYGRPGYGGSVPYQPGYSEGTYSPGYSPGYPSGYYREVYPAGYQGYGGTSGYYYEERSRPGYYRGHPDRREPEENRRVPAPAAPVTPLPLTPEQRIKKIDHHLLKNEGELQQDINRLERRQEKRETHLERRLDRAEQQRLQHLENRGASDEKKQAVQQRFDQKQEQREQLLEQRFDARADRLRQRETAEQSRLEQRRDQLEQKRDRQEQRRNCRGEHRNDPGC